MQVINHRNKSKRRPFLSLKNQFETKSRTSNCTVHKDCHQDRHEDGQTVLATQTPNYSKNHNVVHKEEGTFLINTKVHYVNCTSEELELAMRNIWKVRDCRAGWRSCEILALPCHSVSVVRFNVKKLFTKVWRIQWLTWWFKNFTQSKA